MCISDALFFKKKTRSSFVSRFLPPPSNHTMARVDSGTCARVLYLVGVCWMDGWTWLVQGVWGGTAGIRWEGGRDTGSGSAGRTAVLMLGSLNC